MADEDESAPAVWDPTARDGAGGWVRRPDRRTHQLRKPSEPGRESPAGGSGDGPAQGGAQGGRPHPPTSHDTPAVQRPGSPPGQDTAGPQTPRPGRPAAPTGFPASVSYPPALKPPGTAAGAEAPGTAGPQPTSGATGPRSRPHPPGPQPPGPQAPGTAEPPTATYRPGPQQPPGTAGPQNRPHPPGPQAQAYPPGGQQGRPPYDAPTGAYRPGAGPSGAFGPPGPPPGGAPGYGYGYPQQPQPSPYGYPQQPSPAYGAPPPGYGYPPAVPAVPAEADSGEPPRRRRTGLLVALVVVLAAGLGGGLVWALGSRSGGSGSRLAGPSATASHRSVQPPPTGGGVSTAPSGQASDSASPSADPADAGRQAKAMDDLLNRNSGARRQVGNAVATVQSCPDTASMRGAAKVFEQAAQQREQLIRDLDALELGAVEGGSDAAALLRTAWQQSADADRAYGKWADSVIADGCQAGGAPRTADRDRADAISGEATASKQSFVLKWNPIANRYGLASRTGDGI